MSGISRMHLSYRESVCKFVKSWTCKVLWRIIFYTNEKENKWEIDWVNTAAYSITWNKQRFSSGLQTNQIVKFFCARCTVTPGMNWCSRFNQCERREFSRLTKESLSESWTVGPNSRKLETRLRLATKESRRNLQHQWVVWEHARMPYTLWAKQNGGLGLPNAGSNCMEQRPGSLGVTIRKPQQKNQGSGSPSDCLSARRGF